MRQYKLSTIIFAGVLVSATILSMQAQARPVTRGVVRRAKSSAVQANAQSNAAFNSYLDKLRSKIDRNWYVPDGKNKVVLSVTVSADGTVTNLSLTSTPPDTKAEQAANDAFNQSQPLDALPQGTQSVRLFLTFDSNADPHGDSSRNISARIESINKEASKSDTPTASGNN